MPIELNYVCRLFSKNLLRNIGYLISYLTKYKVFIIFGCSHGNTYHSKCNECLMFHVIEIH
jgi:hypothetical protein